MIDVIERGCRSIVTPIFFRSVPSGTYGSDMRESAKY